MTKKSRTAIFIVLVLLFFLTAPSAILYSQGYRLDFSQPGGIKLVQTGGFYFKISQAKAQIYINGKFQKNTSLIGNDLYVENLLPNTYKVEVKKDGYHPWTKNLAVKESEVTEARNITLFPENPQFTVFNQPVPKITPSATSTDKKKRLEFNDYEIWVRFLGQLPPEITAAGQDRIFLTRFSEKIGSLFWLNNYYLIFTVGDKIKIAEIDNRDGLNVIDLAEFKNPKIFWDIKTEKLYVKSGTKIYLLEKLE